MSGVQEGLCLVNAMHITASVFNDDEPGLHEDYEVGWSISPPSTRPRERYHHNRTGEDNGDAHHKRQVMGREVVVAITRGKLDFGPWEQIFYGEFDGRRPSACWSRSSGSRPPAAAAALASEVSRVTRLSPRKVGGHEEPKPRALRPRSSPLRGAAPCAGHAHRRLPGRAHGQRHLDRGRRVEREARPWPGSRTA